MERIEYNKRDLNRGVDVKGGSVTEQKKPIDSGDYVMPVYRVPLLTRVESKGRHYTWNLIAYTW